MTAPLKDIAEKIRNIFETIRVSTGGDEVGYHETLDGLMAILFDGMIDKSEMKEWQSFIESMHRKAVQVEQSPPDKGQRFLAGLQEDISCIRSIIAETGDLKKEKMSSLEDLRASWEILDSPVRYARGVGPGIAALLERKGLKTIEDLLYFLPRAYEDRRRITAIADIMPGMRETATGTVVKTVIQKIRKGSIFEVVFDDGTGALSAKWFHGNKKYLEQTFRRGRKFMITGEVRANLWGKEMIHPDYELLDAGSGESLHFKRIVPLYSETEGLHQKQLRRIMKHVVDLHASAVWSPIPRDICLKNRLIGMGEAMKEVHFPDGREDIRRLNDGTSKAHRRLVFDEFFYFQLGLAQRKKNIEFNDGIAFNPRLDLVESFLFSLPFKITGAQRRVIDEIIADMAKPSPMNRLLQGDVGSGKTVVAMAPFIVACANGYQAALMAPTEILAAQHYQSFEQWSRTAGLRTTLLTGSMLSRERRKRLEEIAAGHVDIVIGTHAVIQEEVAFKNLGMAIIDEQHKFGVMQRVLLSSKSAHPDVLVMTATPIPRTLAMTVYGDLSISVIDEMPPGKIPVKTKVFYEHERQQVYNIIQGQVEKGRQVFIVYPIIEESESLDLKAATTMAEHLARNIFPQFKVGLVHGKLKASERNAIMESFKKDELDILVSTTVIEVGIDIPTASLMIIEHAERFGLSQLHQLRGRVGRGAIASYCILMTSDQRSEDARKRLRIMEQTTNGFHIAEEDLAIRGPGEFLGTRQSGLPDFRIANIVRDAAVLSKARDAAAAVVERDPFLKDSGVDALKAVLARRWEGKLKLLKTG
ncbi:MAG: ATP-dependent DNA helicase RecG [Deltaproteobacteria bacterium]|nr:ATP-dependent DNA helicase RecG [Deltaproteobacteria bacterium]